MQQHEPQSETPTSPMPMSKAEVDELIRLTSERETPAGSYASTADLAEALRLPEAEVQAMLARLRAQSVPTLEPIVQQRQRSRDVAFAIIAALVVMFMALFFVLAAPVKVETGPNAPAPIVQEQALQPSNQER